VKGLAAAFRELIGKLDLLEIPFMVGGSLASSIHGVYRSTNDVDLIADLSEAKARRLCEELSRNFYADADAAADSVRRGRSFNLIHYATSYKFDIFPLQAEAYAQAEFARRSFKELTLADSEPLRIPVASAEDTVLTKLVWYRLGGEASERQWSDVLGVLRTLSGDADRHYLEKWAVELRISDLLNRALRETLQ
jgi:hypothetical protein